MKISKLVIQGVGGIGNLEFIPHHFMNILCGPNGVGKTTILECIAHLFSAGSTNLLKRNFHQMDGFIKADVADSPEGPVSGQINILKYMPSETDAINGLHRFSNYVLALKASRTFGYHALISISRDTDKPVGSTYTEAREGISLLDVKNWFVNRFLYSAHVDSLRPSQLKNFDLAKSAFSLLNPDYKYLRVDASTHEIMVSSPTGEIYYEYLSSGFKSALSIVFGIIKEIEFRFPNLLAKDFEGIILIDELELHLHPEWQTKIVAVLSEIFPAAQFFVTTHSPHVIQHAARETIIALQQMGEDVIRRTLPDSEYGFRGWTIEEVLEDVMGMNDTRTSEFNSAINEFGNAVSEENVARAKEIFLELDKLLHPNNPTRKFLRLQLAGISGPIDD